MENKTLETKKFKKVRTIQHLEEDPRVKELFKDNDGWYLQLVDGYELVPCGTLIYERTIGECCALLNYAVQEVKTNEQPNQMEQELKELGVDLAKKFIRIDNKTYWAWDFKVKGFNFWMTAEKGTDGIWEFITWYDEMKVSSHWDTRKWSGWDIRTEMVAVFFS